MSRSKNGISLAGLIKKKESSIDIAKRLFNDPRKSNRDKIQRTVAKVQRHQAAAEQLEERISILIAQRDDERNAVKVCEKILKELQSRDRKASAEESAFKNATVQRAIDERREKAERAIAEAKRKAEEIEAAAAAYDPEDFLDLSVLELDDDDSANSPAARERMEVETPPP